MIFHDLFSDHKFAFSILILSRLREIDLNCWMVGHVYITCSLQTLRLCVRSSGYPKWMPHERNPPWVFDHAKIPLRRLTGNQRNSTLKSKVGPVKVPCNPFWDEKLGLLSKLAQPTPEWTLPSLFVGYLPVEGLTMSDDIYCQPHPAPALDDFC